MKLETENSTYDFMSAMLKMFEKTLGILVNNLENKNYVIEINSNVFKSHLSIMKDLATDFGKALDLSYEIENELSDVSKITIISKDYDKLLSDIKDVQLYTKFQTSQIRGRA